MNHSPKNIQSVERALAVLELLAKRESMGLSQLAQESGLNKATVYRLLATMQRRGFVRQSRENARYSLGWRVVELAGRLLEGAEVVRAAHGRLERLAAATQEAAHLGVLDGTSVVYIAKVDSPLPIRIASRIGARVGIHCTALGKAILAWMDHSEAEVLLRTEPLARRTPRTKTDLDAVLAELVITRRRGFSLDEEENEPGIICLAAPILDNTGRVCAAVSISGPEFRVDREDLPAIARLVQRCAEEISADLGCSEVTYSALVPPATEGAPK